MSAVTKVLNRVLSGACVLLFAVLVLTVSWQVFSRQVLNSPSAWSESLAKYIFVWLGMFGAALVFSERGHIAVDLLVHKFSAGVQRLAAAGVQLAVIAFAAPALVWGGSRMVSLTWGQTLPSLPLHEGAFQLVMPVTGAIVVYYATEQLIALLRRDEPADTADGTNEAI